jgi:histidyl-tRNA synthetase
VFPDEKKLTQQFVLAEKKGIPWMIIPGDGPSGGLTLRDLVKRENREGLRVDDIIGLLKQE